jgi:hypothetical protein
MAFRNSLRGTMKVVLFHGSSNKLTFKLNEKWVFNNWVYSWLGYHSKNHDSPKSVLKKI